MFANAVFLARNTIAIATVSRVGTLEGIETEPFAWLYNTFILAQLSGQTN